MKRLRVCFLFLATTSAFAQTAIVQDFVIDQSKPYVYLKFDHIGPRKPVQAGEGNTGIWLRVVSNCRIPIVFLSSGTGILDEVVDTEPTFQIFNSVEEEKAYQRHEQLRKLRHKPLGYRCDVCGITRVQPGKDLLFSVPLNHVDVDGDWYMRVKFALDLNESSISVGPFTYLPFDIWDIPKEFRPTKVPNASQEPKNPPSTIVHESEPAEPPKPASGPP
jgi:hypothetical protein